MRALVDTSVWSLALRRREGDLGDADRLRVSLLAQLIDESRVLMVGAVRQELLSGIRDPRQFRRLSRRLRAFPDEPLEVDDYEEAAAHGNTCRAAGLAVASVDLLLCAVTIRRDATLFTTDADFARYATVLPLRLVPDPAL